MHHIQISELREIGWREWDPIGIWQFADDAWQNGAADEYDSYLAEVARGLRAGWTMDEAVEYLVGIECEHIGFSERPTTRPRAEATVKAIRQLVGGNGT